MNTIETFKLDNTAPENLRNCSNCAYQSPQTMPGQILSQLVCHRFPPAMFAVPAPGGYQLTGMQPIVMPEMFCHEHKTHDELHPIITTDVPSSYPAAEKCAEPGCNVYMPCQKCKPSPFICMCQYDGDRKCCLLRDHDGMHETKEGFTW